MADRSAETIPVAAPDRAGFQLTIDGTDTSLSVEPGQSMLDAALRAAAWIPHSCTQGTCGTCKVRVLCGAVDHRDSPDYTLTADERCGGLALACRATPTQDVRIQPVGAVDDGVPRHPLRDYTATVIALEDIARDIRRLVVEPDTPMAFNAGQYAELIVPGHGVARQYSMANPPDGPRVLEFHVKRTPGGVATEGWIFAGLAVGDPVALRGPLGQFHLVHPQPEPAILIGGGTGLAPLVSIARHALSHNLVPEVFLYHGGRREEDLYDVEVFRELERVDGRFHYRPALSEQEWSGATGMVTDVVVEDFLSCKGMSAYLCGPPAMVAAAQKALKRRRMPPRQIRREEFTPAPPAG